MNMRELKDLDLALNGEENDQLFAKTNGKMRPKFKERDDFNMSKKNKHSKRDNHKYINFN